MDEQILDELRSLRKSIDDRLNKIETNTNEQFQSICSSIEKLKVEKVSQDSKIDEIKYDQASLKDIINNLVNSDAVLRREKKTAVLEKTKVYEEFERHGVSKRQALVILDKNKLLVKGSDGDKLRVCWDGTSQKAYRAVVIRF